MSRSEITRIAHQIKDIFTNPDDEVFIEFAKCCSNLNEDYDNLVLLADEFYSSYLKL